MEAEKLADRALEVALRGSARGRARFFATFGKSLTEPLDTTDKICMSATASIDVLARLLDVADLRHRVIAQNMANVNTPGYHRKQVDFEDAFQKALQKPEGKPLQVEPKVVEGPGSLQSRVDGNTVDIDLEMAQLAKNTLLYQAFAQIIAHRIGVTRTAITSR